MKKLTEQEWERVFKARCKSKSGQLDQVSAEDRALIGRAFVEDGKRYGEMEDRVFNATVPFGARVKSTGAKAARVRSTSPRARRVDPAILAAGLGAERVPPSPLGRNLFAQRRPRIRKHKLTMQIKHGLIAMAEIVGSVRSASDGSDDKDEDAAISAAIRWISGH